MSTGPKGSHESSLVSVDVVALRLGPDTGDVDVLVHRRALPPWQGRLALPGVLLGRGERITAAAGRALAKAGVIDSDVLGVGQLVTFDQPNRDPRGPTLSIALWAGIRALAPLSDTAEWVPIDAVPTLAFDHNRIIDDVRPRLARMLWVDRDFTRALTGAAFPVRSAIQLTASLTAAPVDRGNLNRTLAGLPGLERVQGASAPSATGRPGAVWAWS